MENIIQLTTWGVLDTKTFKLSKGDFNNIIKEIGWSEEDFLNNYTFDDSKKIYDRALELNLVISEKESQPFLKDIYGAIIRSGNMIKDRLGFRYDVKCENNKLFAVSRDMRNKKIELFQERISINMFELTRH